MICRRVIILLGCFVFFLHSIDTVHAQDTFGPICDGVTVTCPPDTPVPTTPPTADTPPPDASAPVEPPRAGHAETLLIMVGLGALFITSGILLHRQATVEA